MPEGADITLYIRLEHGPRSSAARSRATARQIAGMPLRPRPSKPAPSCRQPASTAATDRPTWCSPASHAPPAPGSRPARTSPRPAAAPVPAAPSPRRSGHHHPGTSYLRLSVQAKLPLHSESPAAVTEGSYRRAGSRHGRDGSPRACRWVGVSRSLADRGGVTSLRRATGLAGLQLLLAPPTGQVVIAVRLRRCPALYAHACDERDCGRGFLSGVVWPAPGAAGAGSAPDVSPCFLCVLWLVRVRRAAWFLRVLQEMLVLRDIPEVPGRLMGDGRAVCP